MQAGARNVQHFGNFPHLFMTSTYVTLWHWHRQNANCYTLVESRWPPSKHWPNLWFTWAATNISIFRSKYSLFTQVNGCGAKTLTQPLRRTAPQGGLNCPGTPPPSKSITTTHVSICVYFCVYNASQTVRMCFAPFKTLLLIASIVDPSKHC